MYMRAWSIKILEARLDAMDGRRKDVNSIRARARLATYARAHLTRLPAHPVQMNNADFFTLWRSSSSKIQPVAKGLQFALDHIVSSSLDARVVN
jgi:hypothetical protein